MKRTRSSSLREDTHWSHEEQTNSVTAAFNQRPSLPNLESCHNHTIVSKTKPTSYTRPKSNHFEAYAPNSYARDLQHTGISTYFEGLMNNRPRATSNASSTAVSLLVDDSKYRAAILARAPKRAMRLAAAEAKSRDAHAQAKNRAEIDQRIVESCEKAMGKREEAVGQRRQHQAHEEEAKKAKADKQAVKQAEAAAKSQRKADVKKENAERKAQRKAERKAEKAREMERKRYMGGMFWGYEPNAGVSACLPVDIQTSRYQSYNRDSESRRTSGTAGPADSAARYYDRVTGKYYPSLEFNRALGVEIGGPNRTKPPGTFRDGFPKAMAGADETPSVDHNGSIRDRGPAKGTEGSTISSSGAARPSRCT